MKLDSGFRFIMNRIRRLASYRKRIFWICSCISLPRYRLKWIKKSFRIYCDNIRTARYTTALLAESSGILAAKANNLPMFNRLKPIGDSSFIQKCNVINVTVGAKETSCGYEPFFNNQTIGRDGYSLHPFRECFWEGQF